MQRRALLATVATGTASLAGCAGLLATDDGTGSQDDGSGTTDGGSGDGSGDGDSGDGDTGDDGDPGDDGDDSPIGDPPDGRASVVDLETAPRTYAFAPTSFRTDDDGRVALWFDQTATDEAPARLVGWLENDNDYENTFDVEWIPAVGRVHSRTLEGHDHTSRLHLAPTERNDLAESVPELQRSEDGHWRVAEVGPWIADRVRLDPGERVRLEYAVVGEPGAPGRPTGTYEFRGDDERVRITVWDTDQPGPTDDSRFAGRSIPPIGQERSIQWYHEADATTPVTLRPARERLDLDSAVDFDLVYNARESTGCGHWNLYKLVDGEWFHVDPRGHFSDCRQITPGTRMAWTLRAFGGRAVSCDDGWSCGGGLTRGYLGGGTYAVVAGYGHPADASGALVELVGDPVALAPTEDATVERDGSEVVVTTAAHGDGEHPPDATLTVERVADDADGDAEPDRVIAEQVMRDPDRFGGSGTLRNALAPFEDGVERVVVRADEYAVDDAIGHDEDVRRVRFRGATYELREVPLED